MRKNNLKKLNAKIKKQKGCRKGQKRDSRKVGDSILRRFTGLHLRVRELDPGTTGPRAI